MINGNYKCDNCGVQTTIATRYLSPEAYEMPAPRCVTCGQEMRHIHATCSKCGGTGMVHFMNMHPEDYEPPVPCDLCNE